MAIDFAHQIATYILHTDMEIKDAIEELDFREEVEYDDFIKDEVMQEVDRCDTCKVWYPDEYCYNHGDSVICDKCLKLEQSGISM
jgi:hypothetical protein